MFRCKFNQHNVYWKHKSYAIRLQIKDKKKKTNLDRINRMAKSKQEEY